MCLLLSSATVSFAAESTITSVLDEEGTTIITDLSDRVIFDTIYSIKDGSKRDRLLELFTTPAYHEIIVSEGTAFTNRVSNTGEAFALINSLAEMSDEDFDEEISRIINETIQTNEDKSNIVWEQAFVDKFVSKYAPNEKLKLNTGTDNVELKKITVSELKAASSKEFQYSHLVYNFLDDTLMYGLGVNVEFDYDGTDVLSLYPTTVAFTTSAWSYTGLAESGQGVFNGEGWIKKVGKFRGPWPVPISSPKLGIYVDCYGDGTWDGDWRSL